MYRAGERQDTAVRPLTAASPRLPVTVCGYSGYQGNVWIVLDEYRFTNVIIMNI